MKPGFRELSARAPRTPERPFPRHAGSRCQLFNSPHPSCWQVGGEEEEGEEEEEEEEERHHPGPSKQQAAAPPSTLYVAAPRQTPRRRRGASPAPSPPPLLLGYSQMTQIESEGGGGVGGEIMEK